MNKGFLAAALVLSSALAGCSNGFTRIDPLTATKPTESATVTVQSKTEVPTGDALSVLPLSSKTTSTGSFFQKMGKVKNVFPIDEKTVLVEGSKLYLYEPTTDKVIAQAALGTTIQSCTTFQNGIFLVGMKLPTDSENSMTTNQEISFSFELYDKALKKTATIALNHSAADWLGDPQINISDDGKTLCYSTLSGLYLYDIAAKKETKILELGGPSSKNAGIATIAQPYFTNDQKSIGFQAQTLDVPLVNGQSSYPTCGVIDLNGNNLINKKPDGFSIYEMVGSYNDYALFSQDFRKPDGKVLKMDIPSGKLSYLSTTSPKESAIAFGSAEGKYYATICLKDSSWVVRIYDTATGKFVREQTIVCSDEVYTYRAPIVRILDEGKTCIVLLGNGQKDYDTSITTFQF